MGANGGSWIERIHHLPPELRRAGVAAAALLLTMLLPWYDRSFLLSSDRGPAATVTDSLSALQVFGFVEAAVLMVAGAVLYLIWARSERKQFDLPGGDGLALALAGGWLEILLVWRVFDRPDAEAVGTTVGVQWGMLAAMAASAALLVAGVRVLAVSPRAVRHGVSAQEQPTEELELERDVEPPAQPLASSSLRWVGPGPPPGGSESSARPDGTASVRSGP